MPSTLPTIFLPVRMFCCVYVIEEGSTQLPVKLLFVVDSYVVQSHADLPEAIQAYCQAHMSVLNLVAPRLVIEGGERAKNDPLNVTAIQEAIHQGGICRHS